MVKNLKNRVVGEANYMINTKETIREIASKYNVSKSTVHKDLSERLKEIDQNLFNNVNDILQNHLAERHIRGGEVTREKYARRRDG